MNEWAMPNLIDQWDNTGFQIGDENKKVNRVLIAMDLDRELFNKAINDNYEMVITHHPLLFKPLKSITSHNYKERLIMDIIKSDLVVYNAHSNLDLALGGVNDQLAKVLGIKDTIPLSKTFDKEGKYGYGRIGTIEEILLTDYLQNIKDRLGTNNLIIHGHIDKKVRKVAVCGGSGSEFIYDAYEKGADVYITGDIKYHDGQLGHELGLTIVDAGHYNTEKIVLPIIKEYLKNKLGNKIEIEVVMNSTIPYMIY